MASLSLDSPFLQHAYLWVPLSLLRLRLLPFAAYPLTPPPKGGVRDGYTILR